MVRKDASGVPEGGGGQRSATREGQEVCTLSIREHT